MPYSGSSYLEDEVLEDLPPFQMAISAIPALTAHILFLFKSSTFGRLVLEHPPSNGNFIDSCPTVRVHIWQTKCWQIYPPSQLEISKIPPLTAHISFFLWELNIWQAMAWHIYPSFKWQFHRFLLWLLIFLSYSESSTFGRPDLSRSTPLSNGYFTDICSDCSYFFPTLRAHI